MERAAARLRQLGGHLGAPPDGGVADGGLSRCATASADRFVGGPAQAGAPPPRVWRNWAGNASCSPAAYHEPTSRAEIVAILRAAAAAGETVTLVGDGHSNNDLACTRGQLLSLDRCSRVLALDEAARTITCEAGVRLKQLNEYLPLHGLALPSLGSIAEQSVAGATATATHGSSLRHGTLSSYVVAVDLILASGESMRISRRENAELLPAARCSLGALGVVYALTLQCVPAFRLRAVERPLSLDACLAALPALLSRAEFFRFWWFPHTDGAITWEADASEDPITPADTSKRAWLRDTVVGYHLLEGLYLMSGYARRIVPLINQAYRRLLFNREKVRVDRSDRVFTFDCLFKQHVSEWAIPASRCAEALTRLKQLIADERLRVHFPVEVRFVRGEEDVWLSPAYGRDTCYIGIIMYRPFDTDVPSADYVSTYFRGFEALMRTLGGRPHWAKPHGMGPAELRAAYPMWDRFLAARARLDPGRLFSNAHLRRLFGEADVDAPPDGAGVS